MEQRSNDCESIHVYQMMPHTKILWLHHLKSSCCCRSNGAPVLQMIRTLQNIHIAIISTLLLPLCPREVLKHKEKALQTQRVQNFSFDLRCPNFRASSWNLQTICSLESDFWKVGRASPKWQCCPTFSCGHIAT